MAILGIILLVFFAIVAVIPAQDRGKVFSALVLTACIAGLAVYAMALGWMEYINPVTMIGVVIALVWVAAVWVARRLSGEKRILRRR